MNYQGIDLISSKDRFSYMDVQSFTGTLIDNTRSIFFINTSTMLGIQQRSFVDNCWKWSISLLK